MTLDAYMIVIRGDPRSEYYYEYCSPCWEKLDINLQRFDAITPKDLKYQNDIAFEPYQQMSKYVNKGIQDAIITETEKACWYSHFKLWQECVYTNKPILIIEHDAFLIHPENFWYDEKYGIIFYDLAAMGSYLIQPWYAKKLVNYIFNKKVRGGPYSMISLFNDKVLNARKKELIIRSDKFPESEKFKLCSRQVMSKKYGNTIVHYSDIIEDREKYDFVDHNFLIIP